MKKALFFLLAAMIISAATYAQNDPMSIHRKTIGLDTQNTLLTQSAAAAAYLTKTAAGTTYLPKVLTAAYIQTIDAHYDTVTGKYLTVVTAARLDSIKLKTSLYSSGQLFKFMCTASANDSTLILPSSGNINGAASLWWTGTYKNLLLWFDGTNYWKL